MSGGVTAMAVAAGAAVAGTAYSIYSGERQANAQRKAGDAAKTSALKQEKLADEATNKANMKRPDTGAIMDAAMQAGKGGAGSTMLTGPGGIDPSALQLGKNTLLGG
jgi:hypothetical protein